MIKLDSFLGGKADGWKEVCLVWLPRYHTWLAKRGLLMERMKVFMGLVISLFSYFIQLQVFYESSVSEA